MNCRFELYEEWMIIQETESVRIMENIKTYDAKEKSNKKHKRKEYELCWRRIFCKKRTTFEIITNSVRKKTRTEKKY